MTHKNKKVKDRGIVKMMSDMASIDAVEEQCASFGIELLDTDTHFDSCRKLQQHCKTNRRFVPVCGRAVKKRSK